MKNILLFANLLCSISLLAQTKSDSSKVSGVKMDILYGYYHQNGNMSPVTGGRGTETLDNHAPIYNLYLPLKDSSSLGILFGVDTYTSASSLNINRFQTSASSGTSTVSGSDTRIHTDLSYNFTEKGLTHGVKTGFSTEYDVLSFNFGYKIKIPLKTYDQSLTFGASAYWDRWLLIYPGEFDKNGNKISSLGGGYGSYGGQTNGSGSGSIGGSGNGATGGSGNGSTGGSENGSSGGSGNGSTGGSGSGSTGGSGSGGFIANPNIVITRSGSEYGASNSIGDNGTPETNSSKFERYNSDWRRTYTLIGQHNMTVNKRIKMSHTVNITFQNGLLSTPYHRVYLNDGETNDENKLVRIENLPRKKVKLALISNFAIFLSNRFILKPNIRIYGDSWKSGAISTGLEIPIKTSKIITLYPFYRFHFQTASEYYHPYSTANVYEYFLTSDTDLSKFSAHKYGFGLKLNPIYGISLFSGKQSRFVIDKFSFRLGNYSRSNGFTANFVTFGMYLKFMDLKKI